MLTKPTYLIWFLSLEVVYIFGQNQGKNLDPHQPNLICYKLPFNHLFRDAMSKTTIKSILKSLIKHSILLSDNINI